MKINRDPNTGHHFMNRLGAVVSTKPHMSIGDSLGRTARAAMVYDEDRIELINGVFRYYHWARTSPEAGHQLYVVRYPDGNIVNTVGGNSRDHVNISISCLRQMEKLYPELGETINDFVKFFIAYRAKRPCINHAYTPGQKIWFKALYSIEWSWVYFAYKVPGLLLRAFTNWILRKTSGLQRTWESPKAFYEAAPKRTKWQKFITQKELILPTYASFYTMYAINAIESRIARKILQVIMRLHFEKHNYVARRLCDQKVNPPADYIPSRSNRWSIRLDASCNRDMRPWPSDTPENNLELGMLEAARKQII